LCDLNFIITNQAPDGAEPEKAQNSGNPEAQTAGQQRDGSHATAVETKKNGVVLSMRRNRQSGNLFICRSACSEFW
jgi:hypothetical protein